jgi:hypothetical protein
VYDEEIMTDIVERLRKRANDEFVQDHPIMLEDEAADEIERLRKALEKIYHMADNWNDDWDAMKQIINDATKGPQT